MIELMEERSKDKPLKITSSKIKITERRNSATYVSSNYINYRIFENLLKFLSNLICIHKVSSQTTLHVLSFRVFDATTKTFNINNKIYGNYVWQRRINRRYRINTNFMKTTIFCTFKINTLRSI